MIWGQLLENYDQRSIKSTQIIRNLFRRRFTKSGQKVGKFYFFQSKFPLNPWQTYIPEINNKKVKSDRLETGFLTEEEILRSRIVVEGTSAKINSNEQHDIPRFWTNTGYISSIQYPVYTGLSSYFLVNSWKNLK